MNWWRIARYAAAAVIVLRVVGLGTTILPPVGAGILLLVGLTVLESWLTPRPGEDGPGRAGRAWSRLRLTMGRHGFTLAVVAAVVLGIGLRLVGLGAELGATPRNTDEKRTARSTPLAPTPRNIDENRLAGSVLRYLEANEVPHETVEHYPGVYYWFLVGGYLATVVDRSMAREANGLDDIPRITFIHAGKLFNVLLFGVTIWLTALLTRRIGGAPAGAGAAFLMAVAPLGLEVSTELRNDVPQLLLVTLALIALQTLHRRGTATAAAVCGILAGLATGIKYSSLFLLVPLAGAAVTARSGGTGPYAPVAAGQRLGALAAGFVAAVMLSNPFVWLDFPNFLYQLTFQVQYTGPGHWTAQQNAAWFYARQMAHGVGWPLLVAAGAWIVHRLVAGGWEARWLASFPVVYVWFMSQRPAQFPRWAFPLLSIVAALAAVAVVDFLREVPRRWAGRAASTPLVTAARVAAVVLLVMPPVWGATVLTSRRAGTPTHELLEAWLLERVERDDRVLTERQWLPARGLGGRLVRTDLGAHLAADDHFLRYHDWIVVPEPLLGRPVPPGLELAASFQADFGLGGNTGYDYRVYTPEPADGDTTALALDLAAPGSLPYLGPGWPEPEGDAAPAAGRPDGAAPAAAGDRAQGGTPASAGPETAGRALPAGSGRLYVPLAIEAGAALRVEALLRAPDGVDVAATRLYVNGVVVDPAAVTVQPVEGAGATPAWRLTARVTAGLRRGINEISLLRPDPSAEILVLRIDLRVEDDPATR